MKDDNETVAAAVDRSGLMAASIVGALNAASSGAINVGESLAAISKAAAMILTAIEDNGARRQLIQKFRVQVGLDADEMAAYVKSLPIEKRPVGVDIDATRSVN